MIHRLFDLLRVVIWAVWFGGLTLYAAVVVPIGTDQIGETSQGMITQQVTLRLNSIGWLMVIVWLAGWWMKRPKSKWLIGLLVCHAVILLVLTLLHAQLTSMLDLPTRTVAVREGFYGWHRVYLIVTTLQWLGGLAMTVFVMPFQSAEGARSSQA